MKLKDQLLNTILDALEKQGQAIKSLGPGLKGEQGVKGDAGQQGPRGPAGADGKDGRDGVDGKDGRDGVDGKNGAKGERGDAGQPGKDGRDGKDGKPGKDGRDGVDGKDGQPGKAGKDGAKGDKGDRGDDGVGIEKITQPDPGKAVIWFTDGTKKTLTLPKGRDGASGVGFKSVSSGSSGVVYDKALSGLSVVIPAAEHGISVPSSVVVMRGDGAVVEVETHITALSISIFSNVNLNGHTARIG